LIEKEILEAIKEGDSLAFRNLVESYIDFAYSLAFKVLGDTEVSNDVVQESFIKIWEKRRSIRSDGSLSPWIRKIVINKCYDHLRKKRREAGFSSENSGKEVERLIGSETSDGEFQDHEYSKLLHRLTFTLSPKQKLVFMLSEIEGMSHDEIAESTGLTKSSIKSNLNHARKNLKNKIEKQLN